MQETKMNLHYPIRFHDKCEEINRMTSKIIYYIDKMLIVLCQTILLIS